MYRMKKFEQLIFALAQLFILFAFKTHRDEI